MGIKIGPIALFVDTRRKMKFNWSWCNYCDAPMVICPKCGNNSCNGHYGCDLCREVQDFIDGEFDLGKYPKSKEEIENYNKT